MCSPERSEEARQTSADGSQRATSRMLLTGVVTCCTILKHDAPYGSLSHDVGAIHCLLGLFTLVVAVPSAAKHFSRFKCTQSIPCFSCAACRAADAACQSRPASVSRSFVNKPLDFDQFMDLVATTGADPYLVLNYDSANKPSANPGDSWDYDKLRDAAVSWVAYIVRKGYQVTNGDLGLETHIKPVVQAMRPLAFARFSRVVPLKSGKQIVQHPRCHGQEPWAPEIR